MDLISSSLIEGKDNHAFFPHQRLHFQVLLFFTRPRLDGWKLLISSAKGAAFYRHSSHEFSPKRAKLANSGNLLVSLCIWAL